MESEQEKREKRFERKETLNPNLGRCCRTTRTPSAVVRKSARRRKVAKKRRSRRSFPERES
jgi:hypothetical protein